MSLFPAKDVLEEIVLTFDFSLALAVGETLTGTPNVAVTLNSGVDTNPAAILNGSAIIAGNSTQVLVPVMGGLSNCSYDIKVSCATSNTQKELALTYTLPILP